MFKVFNMGHRMEIYIDEKYADSIIKISKSFMLKPKLLEEKKRNQKTYYFYKIWCYIYYVRKARTNTK